MRVFVFILVLNSFSALALPFNQTRKYQYSIFETEQKCIDYQRANGMWFNCFKFIEFRPDGSALVITTDIANAATYDVDFNARTVTLKRQSIGDMPSIMKFKLSSNLRALIDSNYDVWEWVEK
jgi:hypothetical protein